MAIDWSVLTDPKEAINLIFKQDDTYDAYQNNNIFQAVVLTPGQKLSYHESAALQNSFKDREAGSQMPAGPTRIGFRARILGPNSPHNFLPEPQNPDFAEDPEATARIIALHTTFITTTGGNMPKPDDVWNVSLRGGADDAPFNLQFGDALEQCSDGSNSRHVRGGGSLSSLFDSETPGYVGGGSDCSYTGPNRGAEEIYAAYEGLGEMSMDLAEKIVDVGNAMGTDPAYVANQMAMESGFQSSIINTVCKADYSTTADAVANCAVGMIQFMPSTATGLGTTTAALYEMSAVEQMTYVQKFYLSQGNASYNSQSDLYGTTFLPASRVDAYQEKYGYGGDFNIRDFYEGEKPGGCDGDCYSKHNPTINTIGEYTSHANANARLKC